MEAKKRIISQRKAIHGRDLSLGPRDLAIMLVESLILSGMMAWIFFDSIYGMMALPGVLFLDYKRILKNKATRDKNRFDREFKEMLVAISDALRSGYSIENAFRDAQENMILMFGNNGVIINDLKEMNAKIQMKVPAEKAFYEFAAKYQSEDIRGFAQVFSFARRLGGEYVKNLRRTIEKIEDKLELKQDIQTLIAAKQMEFRIMCIMPIAVLAYVKFSSGDFLDPLYGNLTGVAVMCGCIGLYVVLVVIGTHIVNIKV